MISAVLEKLLLRRDHHRLSPACIWMVGFKHYIAERAAEIISLILAQFFK